VGFPPYKSVSVSFRILSTDLLPKTLADIAGIIGNHESPGDFVELHAGRLDGVAVEDGMLVLSITTFCSTQAATGR
jgi:hypothetical protein